MKIKFSIITPTYNRLESGYLLRCIQGVADQNGDSFLVEHIVVNDGSTDNSVDFLTEQAQQNKNLVIINKKNEGVACAWRTGIEAATGNYLVFLDDDDELTANSLKARAEYIRENPSVDWFYARALWIDGESKRIKNDFQSTASTEHLYERMLVENEIHSGTVAVKRSALEEVNWPNWLKRSQDYFLWLELLRPERSLVFGYLNKNVVRYRWHEAMHTVEINSNSQAVLQKERLNDRIRQLHDPELAYLAKLLYKTRKQLAEAETKLVGMSDLKDKNGRLELQLEKIIGSRSWKLASFISRLYVQLKRIVKVGK